MDSFSGAYFLGKIVGLCIGFLVFRGCYTALCTCLPNTLRWMWFGDYRRTDNALLAVEADVSVPSEQERISFCACCTILWNPSCEWYHKRFRNPVIRLSRTESQDNSNPNEFYIIANIQDDPIVLRFVVCRNCSGIKRKELHAVIKDCQCRNPNWEEESVRASLNSWTAERRLLSARDAEFGVSCELCRGDQPIFRPSEQESITLSTDIQFTAQVAISYVQKRINGEYIPTEDLSECKAACEANNLEVWYDRMGLDGGKLTMEQWAVLAPEIYSRVPVVVVYPWRSGTARAVPTMDSITDNDSPLADILQTVSLERVARFMRYVPCANLVPLERIEMRWIAGLYSGELMRAWPLQERILARNAKGMMMTREDDLELYCELVLLSSAVFPSVSGIGPDDLTTNVCVKPESVAWMFAFAQSLTNITLLGEELEALTSRFARVVTREELFRVAEPAQTPTVLLDRTLLELTNSRVLWDAPIYNPKDRVRMLVGLAMMCGEFSGNGMPTEQEWLPLVTRWARRLHSRARSIPETSTATPTTTFREWARNEQQKVDRSCTRLSMLTPWVDPWLFIDARVKESLSIASSFCTAEYSISNETESLLLGNEGDVGDVEMNIIGLTRNPEENGRTGTQAPAVELDVTSRDAMEFAFAGWRLAYSVRTVGPARIFSLDDSGYYSVVLSVKMWAKIFMDSNYLGRTTVGLFLGTFYGGYQEMGPATLWYILPAFVMAVVVYSMLLAMVTKFLPNFVASLPGCIFYVLVRPLGGRPDALEVVLAQSLTAGRADHEAVRLAIETKKGKGVATLRRWRDLRIVTRDKDASVYRTLNRLYSVIPPTASGLLQRGLLDGRPSVSLPAYSRVDQAVLGEEKIVVALR